MDASALLGPSDYAAIEAALLETRRGRWFLAEHAQRSRLGDTRMLLAAMARLEAAVCGGGMAPADGMRERLAVLAAAIGGAGRELAAVDAPDAQGCARKVALTLAGVERSLRALGAGPPQLPGSDAVEDPATPQPGRADAAVATPVLPAAVAAPAHALHPAPAAPATPWPDALAALAALTPEERIALFT